MIIQSKECEKLVVGVGVLETTLSQPLKPYLDISEEQLLKISKERSTRIYVVMASEKENFHLSGPLHLTYVDWTNAHHRKSVAASLVQGVYILERDRQQKRQGSQALAPSWWEFFHFQLHHPLVDDVDFSIFGAIYEYKPQASSCNYLTSGTPRYVIAFRGTLLNAGSFSQDLKLDPHVVQNGLHLTSRFGIAMQAVQNKVAGAGYLSIWLAGHSLGSAMAMLAGKNMARTGIFLEAYLFNPPFISAPIGRITDKTVKHGIRIASSFITADSLLL